MDLENVKAREVMRTEVIKVTVDTTLNELAEIFEAEKITGVPVVEGKDKLIGAVSVTDLLRSRTQDTRKEDVRFEKETGFEEPGLDEWSAENIQDAMSEAKDALETRGGKRVEEIMTPWSISVYEDSPIKKVAEIMVRRKIHRVFITDKNGFLKGIITSMDLTRLVAGLDKGI